MSTSIFFGGEPTLEYTAIKELVLELKQMLPGSLTIKFVLHTNGLLLSKISKKLLNELSLIMFSINYEKIPKYNLTNSYFSTVIENAIAVKTHSGTPMIARLTITEKTSLYTEILLVSNFFDLVYWQIENCEQFQDFSSFYATYCFEVGRTFDYWLEYLKGGVARALILRRKK